MQTAKLPCVCLIENDIFKEGTFFPEPWVFAKTLLTTQVFSTLIREFQIIQWEFYKNVICFTEEQNNGESISYFKFQNDVDLHSSSKTPDKWIREWKHIMPSNGSQKFILSFSQFARLQFAFFQK
jgi:hypothetical protein